MGTLALFFTLCGAATLARGLMALFSVLEGEA